MSRRYWTKHTIFLVYGSAAEHYLRQGAHRVPDLCDGQGFSSDPPISRKKPTRPGDRA